MMLRLFEQTTWALHQSLAVVVVAAALHGSPTTAYACSCDTEAPPCRAFNQSDVVFSGRVEAIELVDAPPPEYSHLLVRFAVDSVLKGTPTSQLTIKTASTGPSCGFVFHEGEHYVVYGYRDHGAIWTSRCARTRALREGVEDLDYALRMSGPGAGASIYGQLRRWDDYLGRSPDTRDLGGLPDILVVAEGPGGPFQARSGQDGRFQLAGLHAGTYRVSVQLPDTLTYDGSTSPVRLASTHACERADFNVHFNGRITGSLRDWNGVAVVGANIVLEVAELADDATGDRFNRAAVTDKDGAFELAPLPPGQYVLGLNIDPHFENMVILPASEGRWVWPRVFYPGSSKGNGAVRLNLGEGEQKALAAFQLPEDLVVRHVTGVAKWPDGRPVAEGWVTLFDAATKLRLSGTVRTTRTGGFEVAAFAGQRVLVEVEGRNDRHTGHAESRPVDIGFGAPPEPQMLTLEPRVF